MQQYDKSQKAENLQHVFGDRHGRDFGSINQSIAPCTSCNVALKQMRDCKSHYETTHQLSSTRKSRSKISNLIRNPCRRLRVHNLHPWYQSFHMPILTTPPAKACPSPGTSRSPCPWRISSGNMALYPPR